MTAKCSSRPAEGSADELKLGCCLSLKIDRKNVESDYRLQIKLAEIAARQVSKGAPFMVIHR